MAFVFLMAPMLLSFVPVLARSGDDDDDDDAAEDVAAGGDAATCD